MTTSNELVSVQATEHLVDALNRAVELEEGPAARTEFLLQRLQELLDRPARCALWIMEELNRQPAPRIVSRTVVPSPTEREDVGTIEMAQEALNDSIAFSRDTLRRVLDRIRTPVTRIASRTEFRAWFELVLVPRYLAPMGHIDCISSMWAATQDRVVFLICHRREEDRPFDESDITLMSLMLRASAPIVDRGLFEAHDEIRATLESLTPREREVLLMLLAGDSEKEIAHRSQRSAHTVHSFVKQLYRQFNVSSRGELMAMFVDKAVMESLRGRRTD